MFQNKVDHIAFRAKCSCWNRLNVKIKNRNYIPAVQQYYINYFNQDRKEKFLVESIAPAHAGKLATEAVDRAMRGEGSPSPIYVGEVIAQILDGKKALYKVPLPKKNGEKSNIGTYTKNIQNTAQAP